MIWEPGLRSRTGKANGYDTPRDAIIRDTDLEQLGVLALLNVLLSRNLGNFVYLWTEYLFPSTPRIIGPPLPAFPEGAGAPEEELNADQNSSGSCPSGWVRKKTR